ncbi:MAG: metalloregulator ArsR/SmtB family transcription factor [Bacteroidales bacterium]|jgi:DNA-binding transcriptional ArsR family regulator|nr:metalloregulator ArsR/SmtB family transcription factor [Bacteroidales bacterium]
MPPKNSINIDQLDNAANKLRALAHPMRVAILEMLYDKKRMNVTEIYNRLGIQQASASHHLGILKNKKVVESRRQGKKTFYSINETEMLKVIDCINLCGK